MCGKKCFDSKLHGRRSYRGRGFRIRMYWCQECRAWHVTNNEKRRD